MKCLTITVDDREFFSGEVAELQWNENAESVSVSARFVPSPTLLQSLQKLTNTTKGIPKAPEDPPESNDSPVPPALNVVRDSEE